MSNQEFEIKGKEEVYEEGTVISAENGKAQIDVADGGDCEACNARAFCKPTENSRLLSVTDPIGVKPGDRVKFKVGGSTLFKASLVLYGVPLIILVGGILFGMNIFEETELKEAYSFFLGSLLTAIYYGIIFLYGKVFKQDKSMPVISTVIKRKEDSEGENCTI